MKAIETKTVEVRKKGNFVQSDAIGQSPAPKKRGRPSNKDALNSADTQSAEKAMEDAIREAKEAENEDFDEDGWNDIELSKKLLCKEFMNVEIELLRESLGMMPNRADLLSSFIASKAPDAMTREEEIALYSVEAVESNMTTCWPVSRFYYDEGKNIFIDKNDVDTSIDIKSLPDDDPNIRFKYYLYDYQIRGMFKDSCGMLQRAKNNLSSELKSYKKVIDGGIYVFPRRVAWDIPDTYIDESGNELSSYDENGRLKVIQRAFRVSGPTGERSVLSSSEVIPAGSRIKFTIGVTNPTYLKFVNEWLNYGVIRGIGQWRNSGVGIFRWRKLDEDWNPIKK